MQSVCKIRTKRALPREERRAWLTREMKPPRFAHDPPRTDLPSSGRARSRSHSLPAVTGTTPSVG